VLKVEIVFTVRVSEEASPRVVLPFTVILSLLVAGENSSDLSHSFICLLFLKILINYTTNEKTPVI